MTRARIDVGRSAGRTAVGESSARWFSAAFEDMPVMAILRETDTGKAMQTAERLWKHGVSMVEVSVRSQADLGSLRRVAESASSRHLSVGAGTVLSPQAVAEVSAAGARFVVSPGLDLDVLAACGDHGLPVMPGVSTPTDIQTALRLGHSWVKVFPASVLGPAWIKAVRTPFPRLSMLATGGVDASNAAAFLAAGAMAVGVGSGLDDEHAVSRLLAVTNRGRR